MFRSLRLRLTFLYILASLLLIAILAVGTYQAVKREFQAHNDLALRYRLAQQLQWQGFPLPEDLKDVGQQWVARSGVLVQGGAVVATPPEASEIGNETEDEALEESPFDLDSYDADLAPVFVISSASQMLRPVAVNRNLPLSAPYAPAAEAALKTGTDLRTIELEDSSPVRLLTFSLPSTGPPQVIQVGRALDDQQRVLDGLLRMLAILGGVGALVLAAGSWWLAGKSLIPAEQAWEKQQAFVANASHELRAPLTLMRASAEVAQRGLPADDNRRPLLGDILSEVDHMATLVDDLLLLSRLDAGRLQLERDRIDLGDLAAEIQRTVGRVAERGGVMLSHQLGDALVVQGDPTRFRQVLLILLDNALRHTPPGGRVVLQAQSVGNRVRVEVLDTGPGIDPQDLPHVFERFYHSNLKGSETGSGLGLAIAKGLIEAQGGTISLENAPGAGTLARIELLRG